jgi:endonuclease G
MIKLSAVFLFLFAGLANATCPQFYPLGVAIDVPDAVELCNSFYAVRYDLAHNEPIISVEKFRAGHHPERLNDFHPDLRLDVATRAEKSDYLHSGYDQGHMTPAADATTAQEMHDTFLLSNMTPQQPTLNRLAWKMLEIKVRMLEPDYVVTGAFYAALPELIGKHHVPVPYGYYKLAYKDGVIAAWVAENSPHTQITETTVEAVEVTSGLKFPRYEVLK